MTNFREQIYNNINTPYGFTPVKRMRLIHGYDDFLNESSVVETAETDQNEN